MAVTYRDRYQMTVFGTPGTGTITLFTPVAGYTGFGILDNGLQFDVVITDGTAWEIDSGCTYTFSGTTLTRGTLVASSTGSAISLSSSAIVMVTLTAERFQSVINSIPTASIDYFNYSHAGGL